MTLEIRGGNGVNSESKDLEETPVFADFRHYKKGLPLASCPAWSLTFIGTEIQGDR